MVRVTTGEVSWDVEGVGVKRLVENTLINDTLNRLLKGSGRLQYYTVVHPIRVS